MTHPAERAPASEAARRMPGISRSFSPGMMGAAITMTGIPASERSRIARSRSCGRLARGSITAASFGSSVVTLIAAQTAPTRASRPSRSMSRQISLLLLTRLTGCR